MKKFYYIGLRKIRPEKRNCYFPDETDMIRLHKKYSQTNCILECHLLYAQKEQQALVSLSKFCNFVKIVLDNASN
jgi:hypothetical protein